MDNNKILIVEDNREYQLFLRALVHQNGEVQFANTLIEAREALKNFLPNLILLDISMGSENGFEFCLELKNSVLWSEIPVVFLTAKEQTQDKVTGLSMGAEDYIVKSADPMEIQVRIRSILNRQFKRANRETITLGGVKLDFSHQRAFLLDSGSDMGALDLTPTEFRILSLLIKNEGKTFSRQKLMEEVSGNQTAVAGRTIDTHIHSLRRKMGTYSPKIESIFGAGYRFSKDAENQI